MEYRAWGKLEGREVRGGERGLFEIAKVN